MKTATADETPRANEASQRRGSAVLRKYFSFISYPASLSHPSSREGLEGFYNRRKQIKK